MTDLAGKARRNCHLVTKRFILAGNILIVCYSHSSQTRILVQSFAAGLEESGREVSWYYITTQEKIPFPFGSVWRTLKMMACTFIRMSIPIEKLPADLCLHFDYIILAGPTWSYNPSGPILAMLRSQKEIFAGKSIIPFISCRSYWRCHYHQLRYFLKNTCKKMYAPVVFCHVGQEPWRTVGVFLKLAGKRPEISKSWLTKRYKKFGHSKAQIAYARELGKLYGYAIEHDDTDFLYGTKRVTEKNDRSE